MVPQAASMCIEQLELPELMKNAHVQKMFATFQEAASQVVQASEMQKALWTENLRLSSELRAVTAELQSLKANALL